MQFRDICFDFEVEPIPVSTLSLQLTTYSIIPKSLRNSPKVSMGDKTGMLRFLLADHFRHYPYKRHLMLFDEMFGICNHWYRKLNPNKMFHLQNQIFFGKKPYLESLDEFFDIEEISLYYDFF